MVDEQELVGSFAEIGRQVVTSDEVYEVLASLARLAVSTVEACDHAGVNLYVEGRLETPPLADPVSETMDQLQVEFDEGPCLDAAREVRVVETSDLRREERWPAFAAAATERTPVRSVLTEPLRIGDHTLGSINLYADVVDAYDDDDRAIAPIFAAYACLALYTARNRQELTRGLETRDVIGQAKGILMARYGLDDEGAFDLLRQGSMRLNRKLRELAQDVVDDTIRPEHLGP